MNEEILDLERNFWAAAGDRAFYEQHFAEDGRCVFAFGIIDKRHTVESMAAASGWATVEFDDIAVIDLSTDTVAIVYSAAATRPSGEEYKAQVSSVYVRREGRWLLAVHQQTPT